MASDDANVEGRAQPGAEPMPTGTPRSGAATAVENKNVPGMPVAWILATVAAAVFVLIALVPDNPDDVLAVTPAEYAELRTFTIFFITALLPSDALIRFGRGILFRTITNAKQAAQDAPRATLPQILAFVAFLLFAAVTLFDDTFITHDEWTNIYDVVKYLIVALLPSEAVIRVGRALFLRNTDVVSQDLAKKV